MTTELEEQFFKAFGIEPKWKDKRVKNSKTYYTKDQADYLRATTKNRNIQLCYPEITDRKLLEMICLIADIHNYSGDVFDIEQNSINELKGFILRFLINYMKTEHTDTFYKNDEVKICIQQLFKEGE